MTVPLPMEKLNQENGTQSCGTRENVEKDLSVSVWACRCYLLLLFTVNKIGENVITDGELHRTTRELPFEVSYFPSDTVNIDSYVTHHKLCKGITLGKYKNVCTIVKCQPYTIAAMQRW